MYEYVAACIAQNREQYGYVHTSTHWTDVMSYRRKGSIWVFVVKRVLEPYSNQRQTNICIFCTHETEPIFKTRLIDGVQNCRSYVCMYECIGASNDCYANSLDYDIVIEAMNKNEWRILIIFRINTHRVHKIKEINIQQHFSVDLVLSYWSNRYMLTAHKSQF